MGKTTAALKRVLRPLLAGALALAIVCAAALPAFGAGTVGDNDEPNLYDFYSLSSIASSVLSHAAGDPDAEIWGADGVFGENINPNGAGALLGFCDTNKVKGIDILAILNSASSAEYSYKTLIGSLEGNGNSVFSVPAFSPDGLGASTTMHVFAPYVVLGAVLSDTGLDEIKSWDSSMDGMVRLLFGAVIMVVYMVSSVVPAIFGGIIQVLKMLNPFQFFAGFREGAYRNLALSESWDKFGNVINFVSDWFGWLYDMSVVILVFLLVILIVRILFSSRARRSASTYKNFLVRALFIFVGIPVLGMSYTQVLDMMGDSLGVGNTSASYVIASTFCDMESFVNPTRVGDNNGMSKFVGTLYFTYNNETGEVKAHPSMNIQALCRAINASGSDKLDSSWRSASLTSANANASLLQMVKKTQDAQSETAGADTVVNQDWVMSVIQRYMTGEVISAATYAGTWTGDHWLSKAHDPHYMEALQKFIGSHTNPRKYGENGQLFTNPEGLDSPVYADMNPFRGGNASPILVEGSNGQYRIDYRYWSPSALSVFNYLNTSFDSSKLRVYSSEKAASDASRGFHYSVSLAGNGFESFVMFFMAVLVLSVDAILGIFYAFGILMKNLSRGIHLITSVPLAMMGSLQAIARIITYTVVMILEILGTIIAYNLLSKLVFTIVYELLGTAGSEVITSLSGAAAIGVAAIAPLILQIIAIIFLIWFIRMALKLRSAIVRTLDQTAEGVISKFVMGTGQATGALKGSEMVPAGQMGSMPERSFGQRAAATAGNAARGVAHGAAAVALMSAGHPAGIAEAAKAAGSMKDATDSASETTTTKQGTEPTVKGDAGKNGPGIEYASSFSGVPEVSTGDTNIKADVVPSKEKAADRVPAKDPNRVQGPVKTDVPQSNPAEESRSEGTAVETRGFGSGGGYTPPIRSTATVANQTQAGGVRLRTKGGAELELAGSTSTTVGTTSTEGGSSVVGPNGGAPAGQSRYAKATDYVHTDRDTVFTESHRGGAVPTGGQDSGYTPRDTYRHYKETHHTDIEMDERVTFTGGGSDDEASKPPPRKPPKK